MTDSAAVLDGYREQLRRAIVRDLSRSARRARRSRLALRAGVPATGALVAGALAVAFTGGTPVSSADAAVLHRVAAALTMPRATILHERALVTLGSTTTPYELWQVDVPPYHFHVLKWGRQRVGNSGAPDDLVARLRSLVESGQARVAGSATIGGVPAYRLTVSGAPQRWLNGTVYVSKSNYHPLEIDASAYGERIVFQTYEYLPATAANLTLMHDAASAGATGR